MLPKRITETPPEEGSVIELSISDQTLHLSKNMNVVLLINSVCSFVVDERSSKSSIFGTKYYISNKTVVA